MTEMIIGAIIIVFSFNESGFSFLIPKSAKHLVKLINLFSMNFSAKEGDR